MNKLAVMVLLTVFASALQANPVCNVSRSRAQEDLKKELLDRYANHYSTVEMLLNAGMKDFDTLCKIPNTSVDDGILQDLKTRYYPNFSTILMLYKANRKSYDNLNK